jgi:hypothetical protein
MRSALYYPHTEIQSEDLMRTALLLWDEIHAIVPWPGYRPHYRDPLLGEAFEVIGKKHHPTEEEKLAAHSLIEAFVTKRKLPPAFLFRPATRQAAHGLHRMSYEVYSQKLMHETWHLLRDSGLAGRPSGADNPTSPFMGLAIMSILADCCSKRSFTRITDRGAAYTALQSVFADGVELEAETIKNELVPVAVRMVNPKRLDLKRLIDFRKREGAAERALRHRLQKHLEEQARIIASNQGKTERAEALRQFKSDTQDDFKQLKDALKLHTYETLGSKEIMTTIVAAVGTAALAGLGVAAAMPEVVTAAGGSVAIGGLIAARSKFVRDRKKLLEEHPTSYLYEAGGGLRL